MNKIKEHVLNSVYEKINCTDHALQETADALPYGKGKDFTRFIQW